MSAEHALISGKEALLKECNKLGVMMNKLFWLTQSTNTHPGNHIPMVSMIISE